MIYTVTFNPSLDYIVSVKNFRTGMTNRTESEQLLPGGKGINVSAVLHNLGIETTVLGFIAGFTGEEIRRRLEAMGMGHRLITLPQGMSRINVKLKNIDGTEINAKGPDIDKKSLDRLYEMLDVPGSGDVFVLAGSIPGSLPSGIYRDIIKRLKCRDVLTVVDAEKDALLNVLPLRPFLIKPNHHELGELFGVCISGKADVIAYGRRLQEMGAQNVLVSMGGRGAVLLDAQGGLFMAEAPEGKLINAVGAGDSMVAGFIAGWMESGSYAHAFKMGLAAGSASAFSEGLADRAAVMSVYERTDCRAVGQ